MGFLDAVYSCVMQNYANFKGRAPRSEYFWFLLFYILVYLAAFAVDFSLLTNDFGIFTTAVALGLLLPSVGVTVRRIHDMDKSGWWYLMFLVPILNFFLVLFWLTAKGTQGENRFGEDPLAPKVEEVFE